MITHALRRFVPVSRKYVSRNAYFTCFSLQGLDSGASPWPVFNRKEAEEWRKLITYLYETPEMTGYIFEVSYQDQVVKRVNESVHHLNSTQGYLLTRRPFQVTWFTNQLAMYVAHSTHRSV